MDSKSIYDDWMQHVKISYLLEELQKMNTEEIEEAFCRNLSFGTGGLRGKMGAGTNRMNVCTVAKASQGVADYIKGRFSFPSVAMAYDSRKRSSEFAKTAASVFAANGIKVWIYRELMPTPCLSYAVRKLTCSAGVVVTASHNPAEDNGYKVYGAEREQSVLYGDEIAGDVAIVYSPLNGTGRKPVTQVLREHG